MTVNVFGAENPSGRGTVKLPLEAQTFSGTTDQTFSGTTDIDDSAQTESTAWLLLTIAAPADAGLQDVEVWFDLNKATTGYGAVETTATILFRVARTVDGTNWRTSWLDRKVTTAITGTNAATDAGQAAVLEVGDLAQGETVRVYADMSADATSDIELPYLGTYKSRGTATVTAVAAG
jgi:hypothetical protein